MRLLHLHITGFGTLRERTVEFAPGMTLLLGPNEAGKSTILFALAQTLYGRPSQRGSFPDLAPWDGGPWATALEFEADGERFRLSRRFDESGARAQSLHRLRSDGAEELVTHEAAEIRRRVAAYLGTADDRIFYRVFCLTQADLSPLDAYGGLREHLERAVSGADATVTTAVAALDARLAVLRRGVDQPALPRNWGPLKRAVEHVSIWETRLLDARREQQTLAATRADMGRLQARLTEAAARAETLTGVLEADRARQDAQTRLHERRELWDALEAERERAERLVTEEAAAEQALAHLPAVYADPTAARQHLHAAEQAAHGAASWLGWLVLFAGLVLGGLFWWLWKPVAGIIVLAKGTVLGTVLLARAFGRRRRLTAILQALGVATLTEAAQRIAEADSLRAALAAAVRARETVPIPDAERRRAAARELAVREEALAAFPGEALTAEAAFRLRQELQTLQEELPHLRERERTLTGVLAVQEEAERDLIDLEDGVAYWRAEAARAKDEEATLLLARELLLEAGQTAHAHYVVPLAARIAPLFAAMTGGRYPRVEVHPDAQRFDAHPVDAAGTPVPPEQLSRGAADQFTLALRLALAQVIAPAPIYLLDDPLLHFDADRRREALAVLRELATRHQIILASHDVAFAQDLPEAGVVWCDSVAASR